MNIVVNQMMKLVKRGYSLDEAEKIAMEQQTKKGCVKDGKLTKLGIEYGKLTSKQREEARKKTDKGMPLEEAIIIYIQ